MIQIENMTFAYPNRKNNIHTNLTLNIETNKVYGLLGKNGTGKSTLLYIIAGLLRPNKGKVEVDGVESCKRAPQVLRNIFLVNEEPELPAIPVNAWAESLSMFYPDYSQEMMQNCLSIFEIDGEQNISTLSMGQRKKAFISFAISSGTSYLLMDEPTNGLDIPGKVQFRKALSLSKGNDRTIVISTHQVHDVESILSHVVIIDNDSLLLNLSTSEIRSKGKYNNPASTEGEEGINLELLFNDVITGKMI